MRTAAFAGLGIGLGTAICCAFIVRTTARETWFAGQ